MSSAALGGVVFVCTLGGALLGMALGAILPEEHLSADSRDVVKLGIGLVGTMAALVLGLLLASAKSSFDTQRDELKEAAAGALLLDRVLAQYGPETRDTRELIRHAVAWRLATLWPDEASEGVPGPTAEGSQMTGLAAVRAETEVAPIQIVDARILALTPHTDAQRQLQSRALELSTALLRTRSLLFTGVGSSIPTPFLVVLIFWVTVIFASFGLFAPRNVTVIGVFVVCALSMAGALFLILELDHPFTGVMKLSSAPLRYTLAHLGGGRRQPPRRPGAVHPPRVEWTRRRPYDRPNSNRPNTDAWRSLQSTRSWCRTPPAFTYT